MGRKVIMHAIIHGQLATERGRHYASLSICLRGHLLLSVVKTSNKVMTGVSPN